MVSAMMLGLVNLSGAIGISKEQYIVYVIYAGHACLQLIMEC